MYTRWVKRFLDIAGALLVLAILCPLLFVIGILVRIKLGSPVIFRQPRAGLNGAAFTIVKFRSMTDARDDGGVLLPDAQRLTRFGRFLRSSSLDELPELLNVLRGEMSLVGPRPLLLKYLPLYSQQQARRHEVRPGITGWAQVNGRNALTWESRFEMDVWYVDHASLTLDIRILMMTLLKVIAREGISQPGQSTMDEFRGSPSVEARGMRL